MPIKGEGCPRNKGRNINTVQGAGGKLKQVHFESEENAQKKGGSIGKGKSHSPCRTWHGCARIREQVKKISKSGRACFKSQKKNVAVLEPGKRGR